MRKLTQRERILLAAVAVVAVVALFMAIEPTIRQSFSSGELAVKRKQLQTAQDLVQLAQITKSTQEKVHNRVGLQGRIISDSLFKEISNRVDLEALNRAPGASALAALHPALEAKAETLLAYKKQHDKFENFNVLKEIRGPIFEGEQPQAVISRQISNLAQKAGLRPNYQLNIKPMPGKKSEKFSTQAKKNLVRYLYLDELADELQQLQAQQKAAKEKEERKQIEAEEAVMEAMYEAWWGNDDGDAENSDEGYTAETESDVELVKGEIAEPSDSEADRQVSPLLEVIPLILRIQLIQFIQFNLNQQIAGALEFREGFLKAQIDTETIKAQSGFFGIGTKKRTTRVKFKPNSVLLSKFETLINRYEDEQAYDMPNGKAKGMLDYDQQLRALTQYVDQTLEWQEQLQSWFEKVPSTYQPQVYTVDMNFNAEIGKIVRLIQSIESTVKWLQVRDLRISIADKNKTVIGANLSMLAEIL